MKALDYLYRMKKANDEMGMGAQNIDEAIKELEALQQRSCDGCIHRSELHEGLTNGVTNGFCVENGFFTRRGFCCNRYEPIKRWKR